MARPGDELERNAALKAGRSWRGAATVRLRDGHEIWIGSAAEPIMAHGRLRGSVSVSHDITAIHEAQMSLADEERFVEAILGATEALVLVLDAQGRVVRLNAACERLSGYRAAEVIGRVVWDVLIPSVGVKVVRARFADLQAGEFPNSFENHWLTRTGELRLISWQNTCLTDDQGAVTHVIATGIDITEARRRHDALLGIETVGHMLAEQGPIPSALDAVLGEMQARMGYRLLSLYLHDGPGMRLAAQRGYRAMPERLDANAGVVGRVRRTGRAELVSDVTGDLDYVPWDESVASEVAVPLLGDGETLGVLNIEAAPPGTMTESDMQFARTIADRLSISLRRSQAREALRDRTRLFTALAEFAAAVNAIREPERLVAALVDAVGAVVPSDTVVITMLDRSDGRYRVKAVRGLAQGAVGAIIEPGVGTAGRAISERAVILTEPHPRAESNAALRDYTQYKSVRTVGVPLIRDDTVLGVISVGRADTEATFTDAEREVFALLGSHAALALANAHLVEEVSALAIHDGLTGLYNRRHFDAALELAIARFKRRGPAANLAAIMFDLDHFGDFNRRHGHLAGDAALRLFGEVLRKRLRSADIVARYGGEEFVAILDDCGLAEASRLADEVRRELEVRAVPDANGQPLSVTVSAGCAVIDPADPTKEALLSLADARLFMAKEAGRNRVVAV
jgi:diguanylate cyclase (GGDEF)-like protein/PAS domain S-box-containing protein